MKQLKVAIVLLLASLAVNFWALHEVREAFDAVTFQAVIETPTPPVVVSSIATYPSGIASCTIGTSTAWIAITAACNPGEVLSSSATTATTISPWGCVKP
jgi:hypothetical protein